MQLPILIPILLLIDTQTYQTIDGFGYALTGGSAYVINQLDANTKNNLLQELFGNSQYINWCKLFAH